MTGRNGWATSSAAALECTTTATSDGSAGKSSATRSRVSSSSSSTSRTSAASSSSWRAVKLRELDSTHIDMSCLSPPAAGRLRARPVPLDLDGLLVGRAVLPSDHRLRHAAGRTKDDRIEAGLVAGPAGLRARGVGVEGGGRVVERARQRVEQGRAAARAAAAAAVALGVGAYDRAPEHAAQVLGGVSVPAG